MAFRATRFDRRPLAFRAERGVRRPSAPDRRAPVREEPIAHTPARSIGLTAWRGRSGRRYVVTVQPVSAAAAIDPLDAVILAVARPKGGPARILDAGQRGTVGPELSAWIPPGAHELHVHRLARSPAARDAIVEDLVDAR